MDSCWGIGLEDCSWSRDHTQFVDHYIFVMFNVGYMVNDVEEAVAFYVSHLDFTLLSKTLPAFADVTRGDLRLLLSGPASSAGRPRPDGRVPAPGGWNRIELVVDDLAAEVDRLRS